LNRYRSSFYDSIVEPEEKDITADDHFAKAIGFIEACLDPALRYNLLDIGFANTFFLDLMVERHRNISGFGCDISEIRIAGASREAGIQYQVVDFNDCSSAYPESFFDFIFAGEIIEHLENTDNLITECKTYLKSGGYIIITTPNIAAWYERILLLLGMMPLMSEVSYESRTFGKRMLYQLARKDESVPIGHLRLFTPAALRELCEYHGLEFVEHRGYYFHDFALNRWISGLYANLAQGIFMVFRKPAPL
jgi:2-polyprenyl-3-methyl-5-hydroxy-6-metoxy-1,4-benzoquinol methylase